MVAVGVSCGFVKAVAAATRRAGISETIVIYSNDQRIKSVRKKIVRPGEMQVVSLSPEELAKIRDNVTVAVEIPEEDVE